MKNVLKILVIGIVPLLLAGCDTTIAENDIVSVLTNVQQSLQPIWQFLVAFSYVLGVWFIGIAIMRLKQYGQMTVMMSTHASLGPSIAYLVVGAGLLYLPTLLDTMNLTIFAYGTDNIQGYAQTSIPADIMSPLIQLIQVIGLIAFLRGWIMLAKLGGHGAPPGTLTKGLMHLLGGILAINITGTIDILHATFLGG